MRSVLVYIAIYFGVFLLMHRMFRRWWYGVVGATTATILTLWTQLLAIGTWALTGALIIVAGLNLMVLRHHQKTSRVAVANPKRKAPPLWG